MADSLKMIISCELKDLSAKVADLVQTYQVQERLQMGTFYITPEQEVIERMARRPQILMFFQQPAKELTENFPRPVVGRISCRIMNKDTDTITSQDLEFYANRIKTLFGGETPFVWQRGKELHSYTDPSKGYHLQIHALNETAAKKVVEQVLDIQSHSPDWEFMAKNEPAQGGESKYDDTPTNRTILGKPYKRKRRRPRVTVTFWYAEIFIDGIAKNIMLCDRNGYIYKPPTT